MASQPSPAEIINLLLIAVLLPLTVGSIRRHLEPGSRASMAGYLCISAGILLAVIEHPLQSSLVIVVKNVLYACGALGFAAGIWRLRAAARRGEVW